MENIQNRLIRYLQDAHATETGFVDILRDFVNRSEDGDIHALFQARLTETEEQALRLEEQLVAMGAAASTGKDFLNSLMGKLSDLMNSAHDDYDKTTQNLIKAYSLTHLQIGMYTALMAFAQSIQASETAGLAEKYLHLEEQAAQAIFPFIAPSAVQAVNATTPAVATY